VRHEVEKEKPRTCIADDDVLEKVSILRHRSQFSPALGFDLTAIFSSSQSRQLPAD
jgi:hypothetical protein